MAKAKQTSDQYNVLRSDMKSKTSEFAKEAANKKQSVLDVLSGVEEADKVKELGHKAKVKLAQEFREKNKDLIAEYKKLGAEHRKNEKVFQELFAKAKEEGLTDLDEAAFKDALMGKSEKKESKESPRKALEKERKTAAIAELERLGIKTDENIEKINAIQFLDDKILIGNTPWAYENMAGGKGTFKKETNRHYYNFAERKAEAKNQGITLPKKKDFENTLKALPGTYSETSWYKGGNILSIILGESMSGFCDTDGSLDDNGGYGFLGSVSEFNKDYARYFIFGKDKGGLYGNYKDTRFVCRPLVKNS